MTIPTPNPPTSGTFVVQRRILILLSEVAMGNVGVGPCVDQLVAEGRAALPQVRIALRCGIVPRAQLAAAAAALRLGGDDNGLLLARLTRYDHHWHSLAAPLRDALIASRSEHMMRQLIDVWDQTPSRPFSRGAAHTDAIGLNPTRSLIAAVWRSWRDPAAIPAITATCLEEPAAFLSLMPLFGADAIPALAQMSDKDSAEARLMAARCLAGVPHPTGQRILTRLLCDEEQAVRDLAADGLAVTTGAAATAPAILEALKAGYASCHGARIASSAPPAGWQETVREYMLDLARPTLPGHRFRLEGEQLVLPAALAAAIGVERRSDSAAPSLTWLEALAASPRYAAMAAELAAHLARSDTPRGIRLGAIHKVAALAVANRMPRHEAVMALRGAACAVDVEVRAVAAASLAGLGDPIGERFAACIASATPHEGAVAVAKAFVKGDPEAGVRAARKLKRFGWNVRAALGGEPVGALDSPPVSDELEAMFALGIKSACESLLTAPVAGLAEVAEYGAACCRLLADRRVPISPESEQQLVAALRVVRFGVEYGRVQAGGQRRSVALDLGESVRFASANTLATRHLPSAFDALCEIANSYAPGLPPTGIAGLVTLGEMRAIPVLDRIAAAGGANAKVARDAATAIRGLNADAAVLLRPSGGSVTPPSQLVRPAAHTSVNEQHQLLRPGLDGIEPLQDREDQR